MSGRGNPQAGRGSNKGGRNGAQQQRAGQATAASATSGVAERKFGSTDKLPILRYAVPSSFANFERAAEIEVALLYGRLVEIILTGVFPVEEEVIVDEDRLANDPHGLYKKEVHTRISARIAREDKYREDSPKLYALLKGNCSKESLEKIYQASTWSDDIETERDPVRLWQIIKRTHQGGASGSSMMDIAAAFDRYTNLKQGFRETLIDYKQRFDDAVDGLTASGALVPADDVLAWDFIRKLDATRYGELEVQLRNSMTMGALEFQPQTVADAFVVASRFVKLERKSSGNNGVQTAYVASADYVTPNDRKGDKKRKKKGGNNKQNSGGGKGKNAGHDDDPSFKGNCDYCKGAGHKVADCPELKKIIRANQNDRRNNHSANALILLQGDDEDDDDVLPIRMLRAGKNGSKSREKLERDFVCHLDSGASASLVREKGLFLHMETVPKGVKFKSVSGQVIQSNKKGFIPDIGWAWYHPNADANVISLNEVEQQHTIEYVANDRFIVHTKSGKSFHFVKDNDGTSLYSCNMSFLNNDESEEDHENVYSFIELVRENEKKFTKVEVDGARRAKDLIKRMGYPPIKAISEMLKHGAMIDCDVTPKDMQRCVEIYGEEIAAIRGRTLAKRPKSVKEFEVFNPVEKKLKYYVDIMQIEGEFYLVSYTLPLGMVMATYIVSKETQSIALALVDHFNKYLQRGFKIDTLYCDGEGGVAACTPEFAKRGIKFNPCGPGQHVPQIERKIRQIKERVRAHLMVLPYSLPRLFLKHLVSFCVTRINGELISTRNDKVSPAELFKGEKLSYKRHCQLGFGEVVHTNTPSAQNNVGKNSTTKSRTELCVVLQPTGNNQGDWLFFNVHTQTVITRSSWTRFPMPNEIVQMLNAMARRDSRPLGKFPIFTFGSQHSFVEDGLSDDEDEIEVVNVSTPSANVESSVVASVVPPVLEVNEVGPPKIPDESNPVEVVISSPEVIVSAPVDPIPTSIPDVVHEDEAVTPQESSPNDVSVANPVEVQPVDASASVEDPALDQRGESAPSEPSLVQDEVVETTSEPAAEVAIVEESDPAAEMQPVAQDNVKKKRKKKVDFNEEENPTRVSSRSNKGQKKQSTYFLVHKDEFAYHMNYSPKKAIKTFKQDGVVVMVSELTQMIDKKVFHPVDFYSLSNTQKKKVIRSSMFVREKFLSTGEFDKLKARLVAGGNMQDKTTYSDVSSPTVSITALLTVAAIAAFERRHVMTLDIGGAYLNALLKMIIHMRIEPLLAAILCQIDPVYRRFLLYDGSVVVQLDKALYGCIESAQLWYEHLKFTLIKLGFTMNPVDNCVFNKMINGDQCTICVYVDDCFMTCKNEKALRVIANILEKIYKEVKTKEGDFHSHIGMSFAFDEVGKVKVTMEGYVNDLLEHCKVTGTVVSPALATLFDVDEEAELLSKDMKEEFHSRVAKLLYLGKRTRPDLLPTIIFLTSRVQSPTAEDWEKLERLMKYLNGTKELGIVLEPKGSLEVKGYIDASYGVHADGKSHSGVVITIGDGPIFVKSTKQKLVAKSSTEAELIALSDHASQVIWTKEFLKEQGHDISPPVIYQDNKSTIIMAQKGKSNSERTRHINIRYFFIKDRIERGDLRIEYLPTGEMIADALTKALQGDLFRYLRNKLLNYKP